MSITRYFAATAAAIFGLGTSFATDVTVTTPGTLSATLSSAGEDLATVTTLTVSGTVNAADLYDLGNKAVALETLDLSAATIVAYDGNSLNGSKTYKAGLIPSGAFAGSSIQRITLPTAATEIGHMAFAASKLTALPKMTTVTAIGDGAFSNCTNLAVTLAYPAKVEKVGSHVFSNCTSITTVNMGTATEIPPYTFVGCTALNRVSPTSQLQHIGTGAFADCTALSRFNFGEALKSIGAMAFMNTALADADLSKSNALASVGDFAFAKNDKLASANFGNVSLPAMGKGVFFDDSALASVILPDGLTELPAYILKGTTSVNMNTLPTELETIGDYALLGNTATTQITIPIQVTYIGTGAMEGMTGLQLIDVEHLEHVADLGEDVWAGVDKEHVRLRVPLFLADTYQSTPQWQDFQFDVMTGVDDENIADTQAVSVQGRFSGSDLQIQSQGAEMDVVNVFDPAGQLLVAVRPASDFIVIDTAAFTNPLFIVSVRLANGKTAALKLKR